MERVGVGLEGVDDGVAGLVVGGDFLFLFVDDAGSCGPAPADLVAGFLEVGLLDEFLVAMVAMRAASLMMAARSAPLKHGGAAGQAHEVDVGAELDLAGVDLEDFVAALDVGQRDVDLAVEAAGAGQGGVEHVGAVGGGDDDDLVVGVEAVHLDEDGVEGLLAFVVSAGGQAVAAAAADGVDFIEEDDAGGGFLGLS